MHSVCNSIITCLIMSSLPQLLQATDAEKHAILANFNSNERDLQEKVQLLKNWIRQSPHLPDDDDENRLRMNLINGKCSVEKAKLSLEGYYRGRTKYRNFFNSLLPKNDIFEKTRKLVNYVLMPQLTPDLCRISIMKLLDEDGVAEDGLMYYTIMMMISELRMSHDYYLSNTVIVDFQHFNLKNTSKMLNISFRNTIRNVLRLRKLRVHQIHMLNVPNFIDNLMMIMKAIMSAKLFERIHVHKSIESLYNFIPREYLPQNYGGKQKSIEELYELWCDELIRNEDYFKSLSNLTINGDVDSERYDDEVVGFGFDGTFKNLCVD